MHVPGTFVGRSHRLLVPVHPAPRCGDLSHRKEATQTDTEQPTKRIAILRSWYYSRIGGVTGSIPSEACRDKTHTDPTTSAARAPCPRAPPDLAHSSVQSISPVLPVPLHVACRPSHREANNQRRGRSRLNEAPTRGGTGCPPPR